MPSWEEKVLTGSSFYVDHPVVPLYKTIAEINVDGVASFDEQIIERTPIFLCGSFNALTLFLTE